MSESESNSIGQREVAYRLFATEYEDANVTWSESDEDRAPNYVITPTGARVNRLFIVGVLTEVEQVGDDILRGRVVDPTGAFVLYAGQYQPDEQAFLERATPPMFVAVTGKANTFQPEDSDQVFTSIRPESINKVDAETRDRWTVQAGEHTVDRVERMATALKSDLTGDALEKALRENGYTASQAHGIAFAIDHYGTTPTYLNAIREMALDSARVVTGEYDEIDGVDITPDTPGEITASDLTEDTLSTSGTIEEQVSTSGTAEERVSTDSTSDDDAMTAAETDEDGPEMEEDSSPPTSATETPADEPPEPTPVETTDTSQTESTETAQEDSAPTGTGSHEPGESAAADDGSVSPQESDTQETESVQTETAAVDSTETNSSLSTEGDELGDFDAEDFDAEEFDLPEEKREEIEEEYGTEFQSGTEVDEPGEADLEPESVPAGEGAPGETSDPTEEIPEKTESGNAEATSTETEATQAAQPESSDPMEAENEDTSEKSTHEETTPTEADTAGKPDDIETIALDVMKELDDGDGANRSELIGKITEQYDLGADAVEEAIDDALMDGKCYEPDESTLKPI